jgi:hypothetical protein
MSTPGDWPQMYLACMSYVRQYQCLAAAALRRSSWGWLSI